ncbi:MAG: tRNA pseudouridine(55) synthase TruB [Lachnospiraceae bacterium]|nr:tRNA pseudouridine(55) synthase TruB [Lachnospiraceae bacterium]
MNGILNVCKEQGYTSHDVVARLRGICHQKKIGHTGTLDPMATGVLPVCFGNATKLCDFLTDQTKTYRAVMLLGQTSDTYDVTGVMSTTVEPGVVERLGEEAIRDAIASFVPGYDQVPPMYSAKKVDGKKLYELARRGIEIERAAVHVDIPVITVDAIDLPRVTFTVTCSKGTYIRSLIHDIGRKLQCGAVMEELVRTAASGFVLEDALTLAQIEALAHGAPNEPFGTESGVHSGEELVDGEQSGEERLAAHLLPTDRALSMYPAVHALPEADKLLLNGNLFGADMVDIIYKAESGDVVDINQNNRAREVNITNSDGDNMRRDNVFCDKPAGAVNIIQIDDGQICRVYRAGGEFIGLYRFEAASRRFRPYKMFL